MLSNCAIRYSIIQVLDCLFEYEMKTLCCTTDFKANLESNICGCTLRLVPEGNTQTKDLD